jgi:cytochrome c nitrite reductase small subunit
MKLPIFIGVIALLAVLGVGMVVTDFTAYLGNDPATCNNCHVMDAVYENWYHAGHRQWATCADCHTPHEFFAKYYIKALSGYHHVTAFSFGNIPVAIRARPESRQIVQDNCIRCHEETVSTLLDSAMPFDRFCFDCHRNVAHGERAITINPYEPLMEGR